MDKTKLVSVRLETKLGALYQFPDMERSKIELMCSFRQEGVPEGQSGQLCLVNASVAVLSVPFRIIKRISIGCPDTDQWTIWWESPEREDECYPA